jgi:hypothetical protein
VAALGAAVVVGEPGALAVEGVDECLGGEGGEVVGALGEVDAGLRVGAEVAVRAAAGDVTLVVGGHGEGAVGNWYTAVGGPDVDRQRAAQAAAAGLQVALPVGLGGQLQLELDLRGDDALHVAHRIPGARGGWPGGGDADAGTYLRRDIHPGQRRALQPRDQHRQLHGERLANRDRPGPRLPGRGQRQRHQRDNGGHGPQHTATRHRILLVRYTNSSSQCGGLTVRRRLCSVNAMSGLSAARHVVRYTHSRSYS